MAEAIVKSKNVGGVEAKSAGLFAVNGSDASQYAKQVLEESGISQEHHSTMLTETEVEWATVILAMTASHKAAIISRFPGAAEKTYTLKEFCGECEDLDVTDPFGGNLDTYRNTFQELNRFIDVALDHIKEA